MKSGNDTKGKECLFLGLLVIVNTIMMYFICESNKVLRVNDEMLYYDVARSIFEGKGLMFRGADVPVQNIAFSLYLAPFFGIADAAIILKMITFSNCFLF